MTSNAGDGLCRTWDIYCGWRKYWNPSGFADNTFLLVFVGTITGVGGGLLRDMMAEVPPYIFVKHIYACASIVGSYCLCVYVPLVWSGVLLDLWICSGDPDAVSGCTLQVEPAEIKIKGNY